MLSKANLRILRYQFRHLLVVCRISPNTIVLASNTASNKKITMPEAFISQKSAQFSLAVKTSKLYKESVIC